MRSRGKVGLLLLVVLLVAGPSLVLARQLMTAEQFFDNNSKGQIFHRYTFFHDALGRPVRHGEESFWYRNGQLQSQQQWSDGVLDGPTKSWWDNGVVSSQGQWSKGKKQGTWVDWDFAGKKRSQDLYESGEPLAHLEWWPTGELWKEQHFKGGLKDGLWQEGSPDGKLVFQENWKAGLKHGREARFFTAILKSGEQAKSREGHWLEGKKDGKWTEWFFTSRDSVVTYHITKEETWRQDVIQDRTVWEYRELPNQVEVATQALKTVFVNGIEDHEVEIVWIYDFFTGAPGGHCVSQKRKGVWDGPSKCYFETGELLEEVVYVSGKKQGEHKRYYKTGILKELFTYKNGLRTGPYLNLNESGATLLRENWLNDKLHGLVEGYSETGVLISQSNYSNGQRHGLWTTWDARGNLVSKTRWLNGLRHGAQETYLRGGQLVRIETFSQNVQHGPVLGWTFTTQPDPERRYFSEQGQYSNGEACGEWTVFNPDGTFSVVQVFKTVRNRVTQVFESVPVHCQPFRLPEAPLSADSSGVEFRGVVSDRATGDLLVGASVSIDGVTTRADSKGFYRLQAKRAPTHSVVCIQPGYFPFAETIQEGSFVQVVNIRLEPKIEDIPAILKVKSRAGEIFMEEISAKNAFEVSVDWNGKTPGFIEVEVNGVRTQQPVTQTGPVVLTFDMGKDFIGSLDLKRNTLLLTAVTASGVRSSPTRLHPVVVPRPTWANALRAFDFLFTGQKQAYVLNGAYPEPAFEIQITRENLGAPIWKLWELVPYIGGREFGLEETQFSLGVEFGTDGGGTVQLGGQTGWAMAGSKVVGKAVGKGKINYESGKGVVWDGAEVALGVEGSIERTNGIVSIFPPLASAENLPAVGRVIKWFNGVAIAKGTVGVAGAVTFPIISAGGSLTFSNASPEFGGSIGVGLSGEVSEKLSVEVGGGGNFKVVGQLPAKAGSYIEKVEAELSFKANLTVLRYKREFERKEVFKYPQAGAPSLPSPRSLITPAGFTPISREFLRRSPYSRFVAAQGPMIGLQGLGGRATGETRLVQNVFPDSEPAMAELNGKVGIAFVYFDPSDPTLQASDIQFIWFDGSSYSRPMTILDDTRSEFAPTIGFDKNGVVVAAWERVKATAFNSPNVPDMLPQLEIVFASYDPATSSWTEPQPLTANEIFDHSPVLRRGFNGQLLLMWQSNDGNELIGTPQSSTRIHVAQWDANTRSFAPVTTMPGGIENAFSFSFAYDGLNALLAYVKDMDGELSTSSDSEIFYRTYNGGNWGDPVRVTNDQQSDLHPMVLYRPGASAELVWRKGNSLARLSDWTTGAAEIIRERADSFTFAACQLACDAESRLALVWQESDRSGADLFYSIYDSGQKVWSKDLRLTSDTALEKDFEVTFASDGTLHLVFNKKQFAQPSASDLYHLIYRLGKDLALAPGDLWAEPANPRPGTQTVLKGRVRNTGDLALDNVAVAFYLGNPDAGGQRLGTVNVAPPLLKAGDQGEASFSWSVPSDLAQFTISAVVDPANSVAERDEMNNRAAFALTVPDLQLTQARVEEHRNGSLDVIGVVQNSGLVPVTDIQILFKAEGRELGVATISSLNAGDSAEVSTLVWADLQLTNRPSKIELLVDPSNVISESNEANNSRSLTFFLTTDTDRDGLEDSWERFFFGGLARDGKSDSDGDGIIDLSEFESGTNPKQVLPIFRTAILRPDASGKVTVSWASQPGQVYQVQYAEDLGLRQWSNLGGARTATGANESVGDTPPASSTRRFYRVILLTPPN